MEEVEDEENGPKNAGGGEVSRGGWEVEGEQELRLRGEVLMSLGKALAGLRLGLPPCLRPLLVLGVWHSSWIGSRFGL